MSSNEDYLDSLLRSVNGEDPSGSAESGKQTDIRNDEMNGARETESEKGLSEAFADDGMDMDELDFPELARLFEEIPEEEAQAQEDSSPGVSMEERDSLPADSDAGIAEESVSDFGDLGEEAGGMEYSSESEMATGGPEAGETVLLSDNEEVTEETVLGAEGEDPFLSGQSNDGADTALLSEEETDGEAALPESGEESVMSEEEMQDALFRTDGEPGMGDAGILADLDEEEGMLPRSKEKAYELQ